MPTAPSTTSVFTQPYYDSCSQCYFNILTVDFMPEGPLRAFTRRVQAPKLTQHQAFSPCARRDACLLALTAVGGAAAGRPQSLCCGTGVGGIMTPDDLPALTAFLLRSGYQFETQLTNMFQASNVAPSGKRLCFIVTYYDPSQAPPAVTYMR